MGQVIMTNFGARSEGFFVKETLRYIIDAGQGAKGRSIIQKLKDRQVDCFVISHGDTDHIGLSADIVQKFSPRIIVISPVVYALQLFDDAINEFCDRHFGRRAYPPLIDFTVNPDIYSMRRETEYKRDDVRANIPEVFFVRHDRVSTPYPWQLPMNVYRIPEFETYTTRSSLRWLDLIESFAISLRRSSPTNMNQLATSGLMEELRLGFLLRYDSYHLSPCDYLSLFNIIREYLLPQIENEMSLICRVGKMVFTGDATAEQLDEVLPQIQMRCRPILNSLTIKINHHGSSNRPYANRRFFSAFCNPQFVIKRDYKVSSARSFTSYIRSLMAIPHRGWIDSDGLVGSYLTFRS